MKKLSDIENFEFTREDISLVGLIFLAFISLLHTSAEGLVVVIPIVIGLFSIIILGYIKDLVAYLKTKIKK